MGGAAQLPAVPGVRKINASPPAVGVATGVSVIAAVVLVLVGVLVRATLVLVAVDEGVLVDVEVTVGV